MYVSNMISNSGNKVPNQFIIEHDDKAVFQSYESVIAEHDKVTGAVILDPDFFEYSTTTMKYLARFLGHGIAETRKRIASGEYKLASLNQ